MAPADNTPDFDNMTPEEIMAWMETLAKRQGVSAEELTTSADMDIAEIDPDTVVIDEPGYVPYGEERPPKPEKPAAPAPAASAAEAPRPAAPPAPSMPPARPPAAPPSMPPARPPAAPPTFQPRQDPPAPPIAQPPVPRPEPVQPAPSQPPAQSPLPLPTFDAEPEDDAFETKVTGTGSADAMAWLESLAADQGDALFNIDLSTLESELEGTNETAKPAEHVSPIDWLSDITEVGGEVPAPPPAAEVEPVGGWEVPEQTAPQPTDTGEMVVSDPFAAGVDPIAWLENLARRSGNVKEEELTTNTAMNIPVPENVVIDEPGYKPFSFDAPMEPRRPPREPEPQLELENPSDFLQSLSDSEGFDENAFTQPEAQAEDLSVDAIERAIASGTVSPEQMQYYLEHQTDRYIDSMDSAPEIDLDEPPVPAELPDWLLEQVGAPPLAAPPEETHAPEPPALVEDIQLPPAVPDMPDWLKEDISAEGDIDLQDIFADTEEEAAPAAVAPEPVKQTPAFETVSLDYTVEVDPNDPWVEAFDLEHEQGMADIHTIPDWYAQNLADPKRIAEVEAQARGGEPEAGLADAALPAETELPVGQLESLPDWLEAAAPVAAASSTPDWLQDRTSEEEYADTIGEPEWFDVDVEAQEELPAVAEIPDWLREIEPTVEPAEVPDWLRETMDEPQAMDFNLFESEPEPEPVVIAAPTIPTPPPAAPPPPPVRPPAPTSASLDTARSMAKDGNVDTALVEYESLIRSSRDLDYVVDDLTSLVKQHKSNPSVYRVLGDGLMRQGNLQAALDIYREALNQL